MSMTSLSSDRTDVFISYSHEDAKYLKRLKTHLAFYERSGLLSVWDDTKIAPGSPWLVEIKEAIKKTRMAILLVSADFLASKFIAETELPPLLAAARTEGAIIIPVILSPCAFKDTALSQFQGVNSPSKPLSGMSRNDKEKTWAEIAARVNLELSKASEQKLDWLWTSTHYGGRFDLRKITPASELIVFTSDSFDIFWQFKDDETFDYAVIDLGKGQEWLTSRLYIFAIMLERMRGLRCFVFLETKDEIDQRFLGIASPREVRWALARRYPWLERTFAKAYSSVSEPDREWLRYGFPDFSILSATGALNRTLTQQLVFLFLQDPIIQQLGSDDSLPQPEPSEWESLGSHHTLWEHAKWLDATRLRENLGDILQQDESTWLKESSDASYTEQARSILRRKGSFVALVDEEMRFRSLIDRQDFLEQTVSHW